MFHRICGVIKGVVAFYSHCYACRTISKKKLFSADVAGSDIFVTPGFPGCLICFEFVSKLSMAATVIKGLSL